MGEGLWEVTNQSFAVCVVLLREQPRVVGQTEESLKQSLGILDSALQHIDLYQPEAARQEGSLLTLAAARYVAEQQAILQ